MKLSKEVKKTAQLVANLYEIMYDDVDKKELKRDEMFCKDVQDLLEYDGEKITNVTIMKSMIRI